MAAAAAAAEAPAGAGVADHLLLVSEEVADLGAAAAAAAATAEGEAVPLHRRVAAVDATAAVVAALAAPAAVAAEQSSMWSSSRSSRMNAKLEMSKFALGDERADLTDHFTILKLQNPERENFMWIKNVVWWVARLESGERIGWVSERLYDIGLQS